LKTYNVQLFVDDIYVKTYYAIPAEDEQAAIESVQDNLAIDFMADENE